MSTEEPEQGSTPRMDPSIERRMFLPRLSRRDLLKYAGMGAGAIGLSAFLEACGVKGAAVSQTTGPTATPSQASVCHPYHAPSCGSSTGGGEKSSARAEGATATHARAKTTARHVAKTRHYPHVRA